MGMERGDKTAQWARVAARIREDITTGRLALGDRVGGEFDLAARFGVSRSVIQRALALLRAEGLLETVHGQGSFVASRPVVNQVSLGPGDRVTARLPEDPERVRMGMAPGVPLLVLTRAGGGDPALYDAAITIVTGN